MKTLQSIKEQINQVINENPTLNSIEISEKYGFAQGTVRGLISWNNRRKNATKNALKKLNNTYEKSDNDNGVTKEHIRSLIKENPSLLPKELNVLYPSISMPIFRANYCSVNKTKKVEKTLTKSDFKQALDNNGKDKKDLSRNKMVEYIVESGVVGLCYGFPHLKCILETMVLKAVPEMTFFGVECKEIIYKGALSTIRSEKLPIKMHKGKSIEFLINAKRDTYAHLLLDYCNTLPTNYDEVGLVIKNDIVKVKGIIAITFMRVLRNGTGDINDMWTSFGNIKTNDTRDKRISCDVSNHAQIFQLVNERYEVKEFYNYQSKSPMCLAIIQRIR